MKNLLIFLAGAGIGSVVTWKLIEKKYKDLADEEIASVVDTFNNRKKELINNEIELSDEDKDKIINADEIILNYGTPEEEEETIVTSPVKDSYVEIIHPNEFGELDEYNTKSWMYWADNVLTDDYDEIVDDPSKFIGDGLEHFGEYEEDSVYVRNNANQTDYEILKSDKEFNS